MDHPILLASLAGLALAAGYALACALVPFGACARCRRVRAGRRLWTYLRALHDHATR